jgi:hypothetical protein
MPRQIAAFAQIGKTVKITRRLARARLRRFQSTVYWQQRRYRISAYILVGGIVISQLASVLGPFLTQSTYALGAAEALLMKKEPLMADSLKYDNKKGTFDFDTKQTIESGTANSAGGGVSATAYTDIRKGISVGDSTNKADFKLTPKYRAADGQKDGNRIIYPLYDQDGWAVYTMTAVGTKEDIVLKSAKSDQASFEYEMNLGDSLVARLEADGSVGVYGNTMFSGNISTGTAKDAELLKKARKSAAKTTRMFVIPAPTIKETGNDQSKITAKYEIHGSSLKMNVNGLKAGSYPLTIDPSIYVVTAAQFMYGNNESNINFDVTNKLIKKNPTSGGRISSWQTTTSLSQGYFGGGAVAADGYLYQVGGNSVTNSNNATTYSTAGSSTYKVPAGVTSLTVKAWGAGGGGGQTTIAGAGGNGGGGGFAQATLSVTPGEILTYYVGTGGTRGSAYQGGAGGGFSGLARNGTFIIQAGGGGGGASGAAGPGSGGAGGGSSGVNGSAGGDGGAGAAGTSSAGGNGGTAGTSGGAGVAGTANAGGNAASMTTCAATATGTGGAGGTGGGGSGGSGVLGSCGGGGGGGGGRYGGGGGGSALYNITTRGGGGGGGGSGLVSGTSTTLTAGSGTTPGNSSDTTRGTAGNGGSGANNVGTPTAGQPGALVIYDQSSASGSVYWAQFDTGNGTVVNANPGNGTCTNWCVSPNYDLPTSRANLSVVAYNGYLYALGGNDSSGPNVSGHKFNTVYVAKLGSNGEPRLWHPTDSNQANWVYWYHDDSGMTLPDARIFGTATAYNNKMYFIGGLDDSTAVGAANSTVWVADILPNGKLGSWSTSTALTSGGPGATYGASSFAYNDKLYVLGGAGSVAGTPFSSNVYYIPINSDGSLGSSWVHTSDFATGRVTNGGISATVWGGYVYITGGCSVTDSNNYCSTVLSDTQIASINADGSLDNWITLSGVTRQTMGASLIAWRNNLYAVGGCGAQSSSTGGCTSGVTTGISYSPINSQGDISPMRSSAASGAGTCTGSTPTNCDLPGTGSVGNDFNASVMSNGYFYVLGGCTNNGCTTTSSGVAFTQVSANGDLVQPSSCPTGSTATNGWCIMNTSMPSGVAQAGVTVFNDTIYVVGGTSNGSSLLGTIYRASVTPTTGLLSSWTSDTIAAASVSVPYVTARANPAGTSTVAGYYPGNLYIFGGCSAASCGSRTAAVNKCDIGVSGTVSNCRTTLQLQLTTAIGGMGGATYANYIYLVGGYSGAGNNTVRYAKFDSSNNVVTAGSGWVVASATLASAVYFNTAFAYNGYLYAVGGFNAAPLNTVQYIKINTSDGSLDTSWSNPAVTLSSGRYGLLATVTNGRAYIIGGCSSYSASACSGTTNTVQSFRIFNNDSGGAASYAQSSNTGADAIGADSAILNGYIYRAGGCTAIDCSSTSSTVYYAPIGADGTIGTWSTTTSLPAARSWGKLLVAGGTLYYVGGNDSSSIPQSNIYYATPSSGTVSSWSSASNGLPAVRSHFGAAVWNNRLYVAGGISNTGDVSASPLAFTTAGSGTYTVPANVTSITVKAWGAGGGGAVQTGIGTPGNGGGGGFTQATLSVTPGENLTYYVGTGGTKGAGGRFAGNGGGFSGLARGGTFLIQAGGGGGGGAGANTNGGNGGAGGGASGVAGSAGSGTATIAGGGGGGTNSGGGTAGTAGSGGSAGVAGIAGAGGNGGTAVTSCATAATGTGGNGGTGGGGAGGAYNGNCSNGGGGGGGYYGGGGGGSADSFGVNRGAAGGGGGSDYVSGTGTTETAGSGTTPGNSGDAARGTAGTGGTGAGSAAAATSGQPGAIAIYPLVQSTVFVSPQLNSGGDITSSWTNSTAFNTARENLSVVAYANNLYVIGGDDGGGNYLSDVQFAKLSTSDGSISGWNYATSLPRPVSGGSAFAANGYLYVVGGRSATSTCSQSTLVAPISSNSTIASGNNPTGLGAQWDESIQKFGGARYGATASYSGGKLYLLGGGCTALIGTGTGVTNDRAYTTALLTQPQIAKYSISFDTDTNVYPQKFLLNGLDNSLGSQWQLKYRTMSDPGAVTNLGTGVDCSASPMTGWGQETNFGNLTLGSLGTYSPLDGSGTNMSCGRYYFLSVSIDAQNAFGFPDDVTRGPTITDTSLRYTSSPQKRLLHGSTFINGMQNPLDSPTSAN